MTSDKSYKKPPKKTKHFNTLTVFPIMILEYSSRVERKPKCFESFGCSSPHTLLWQTKYVPEMLTKDCVCACVEMALHVLLCCYVCVCVCRRDPRVTDTCWHLKEVSGVTARQTGTHSLCLASCWGRALIFWQAHMKLHPPGLAHINIKIE